MIKKKSIQQWKLQEVEDLVELFKTYKNIAVIVVAKINDKQIQFIRKQLRGKAVIKMSKKSLQIRAIKKYEKQSKKKNLNELANNISGQSSLVFTNMEILELKNVFIDNEWMVPAKSDEITPVDIWVPEGDTGFPTGQVISELNMTLRLPTRIQNDTIWIREPTRTHKTGDFVSVKEAAILKKLGIMPIKSLIKIHLAWSNGEIIPSEVLYLDLEKFQQEFISCYLTAQKIALELEIIDKETIEPLMQKAFREALGVLFEMPIFLEDMADEYIRKAVSNANIINATILGSDTQASVKQQESKPEKKEDDDDKEENIGIGGLFGE
ncbi:MAG: 50S ribosomal protein L10 [Promethearchaeota archaeon]